MAPLEITILGSTGSIGTQALDVISHNPERFRVVALSAQSNVALLAEQVRRFRPKRVSLADPLAAASARALFGAECEVLSGEESLLQLAANPETEVVVAAVVGFAGLRSVVAALEQRKCVALANKESLVAGGPIIRALLDANYGTIVPIDSEHNSIFQLLAGRDPASVRRVLLTASGGPFLHTPLSELIQVTPKQAIAHPRWKMGAKISVDSATLMNKGLELIEARWLFDVEAERLGVIIHPQSLVHGLLELKNNTVLAALSRNDMRLPIAVALDSATTILGRPESEQPTVHTVPLLDLATEERLEFFRPDSERFPALELCLEALKSGNGYPAVLNAANEVAVGAFLEGRLNFPAIVQIVAESLGGYVGSKVNTLDDVISADEWGRGRAAAVLARLTR